MVPCVFLGQSEFAPGGDGITGECDGAIYAKRDDLDAHRNGVIKITQLEPSDERIQDFGAIVVVSVCMDMRGLFQGAAFTGPFRYTRIWRAGDNGWRVVAGHVSAIANA